jgi:hypothetical protein
MTHNQQYAAAVVVRPKTSLRGVCFECHIYFLFLSLPPSSCCSVMYEKADQVEWRGYLSTHIGTHTILTSCN